LKKSLRIKFFKYESFVQTFLACMPLGTKVCRVEGQSPRRHPQMAKHFASEADLRGRLLSLEQSCIAFYLLSNAVIDKTAQWAVFQEGMLYKRKHPLILSVLKFACRFNRHVNQN